MSRQLENLIFITCDEMRGDVPSFMGNPDCRTPNIDRIAQHGVKLRQHFAVHGKCVPSRVSMLTGRYTHTDGYRTVNKANFMPPGTPNLLTALKSAGYESACFGHSHKWQDMWGDNTRSSGCVDYHSFTAECFDDLLDVQQSLPDPGNDAVPIVSTLDNCLEVTRRTGVRKGHDSDTAAMQAIRYLKHVRDPNRPFYLQLDFGLPHPPYTVEEPYFSMYDRNAITPFEYGIGDNAPLCLQKMREIRGAGGSEAVLRQLQAVYYGMCSKVDTLVGKVLDVLDELNLWHNSIVIFTSDHGDFSGQYGLPEKWDTAMNDCILHVPCVVCMPGENADRWHEGLTEHTDLTPTILDRLGLQANWLMHGQSLRPMFHGQSKKQAVFADGGHEQAMRDRFNNDTHDKDGRSLTTQGKQLVYATCPDTMARTKMVRTDRWKLVIRETGGNELYDMHDDPNEMHNLWATDGMLEVTNELMLQMLQWCLRTDTGLPYMQNVGA